MKTKIEYDQHFQNWFCCFLTLTALLSPWGTKLVAAPGEPLQVKMATILPKGLGQDAVLVKLRQDWGRASRGSVELKSAAGGQKDGEATIVRKLRSGNYQAALLSVVGLSEIEPDTAALQNMPLVFRDWDEVDYIREKIRPRLEQQLREKGFTVLFWADSGWVNFFAVKKATTPDEFKRMTIFAWAGEGRQVGIMKSLGYRPVALETENLHSSFANRMIEAGPIAPTFGIAVQIPTVAPHLLEVNWAPIVGAAIIRNDVWQKVSPDLQKQLLGSCDIAGANIRAEGRRFHQAAIGTLRKGPKTWVHTPNAEELAAWEKLSQELQPKVRGNLVPAPIFDEVHLLLGEFRAGKSSTAAR